MKKFNINHFLNFTESGDVLPLTIEQLLDNDVRNFYKPYYEAGKLEEYRSCCGYIYYLGNPDSPVMQEGLSEEDAVARAKHDYDLPADFKPSIAMERVLHKYRKSEMTILFEEAISLQRTCRTAIIVMDKYRDLLSKKVAKMDTLTDAEALLAVGAIVTMVQQIRKEATEFPKLIDALRDAKESIFNDSDDAQLRGGVSMLDSMDANFAVK